MDDRDAEKIAMAKISAGKTVNHDEVAFFAKLADTWWDPEGPFKPLHKLNPTRLNYIRQKATDHFSLDHDSKTPFTGLSVLDIGCGGGLVSEPLARLGADVTGVDASAKNIGTAKAHAAQTGVDVTYRNMTSEDLIAENKKFDLIINMEVVEHVEDVALYLSSCRALVKPKGLMLISTLNRNTKSFIFAILGAEYILRWLPVGAHDWRKFITPDELSDHLIKANFNVKSKTGFVFSPFGGWSLSSRDLSVNYSIAAEPDQSINA